MLFRLPTSVWAVMDAASVCAGNYLGLCAVAVPNGFTAGGLPTSLQVMCAAGQEAMALRIAWAYEQATAWRDRRPPQIA